MDWKARLRRLVSPFISALVVLLLLLSVGYPTMLLEAKAQRQDEVRLQVDQLARYFEQSVLKIFFRRHKNSHRPNGQWHQVSSLYSAALRVIIVGSLYGFLADDCDQ